jgi:hypothetical protein
LRYQFTGQTPNAAGGTDPIPPQVVLHHRGPCIQVSATVAATIAAQLNQQGIAVPAPVAGLALIDTGATQSCSDDAAAQQLRLPVVDGVTIASASPRTIGAPLAAQGILALIGRDLLQFMALFFLQPHPNPYHPQNVTGSIQAHLQSAVVDEVSTKPGT